VVDSGICVCGSKHYDNDCPVLERAVKLFGEGAVIGKNAQYPDAPLHVGKKERGEYKLFGAGKTFDEAFASVKKVQFQYPNGRFKFFEEPKKEEKKK